MARTHSCCGDFRSALRNEKDAYTIYREQVGLKTNSAEDHDKCPNNPHSLNKDNLFFYPHWSAHRFKIQFNIY